MHVETTSTRTSILKTTSATTSKTAQLLSTGLLSLLVSIIVEPTQAQVGPTESAPGRIEITSGADSTSNDINDSRRVSAATPPIVGRKAAQKYMGVQPAENAEESTASRAPAQSRGSAADHYLALHIGTYITDDAYKWGSPGRTTDVGKLNAGVTYRIGEWVNSMDLALRLDVSTFDIPNKGGATKIAVVPVIQFPDASSGFPLYFGAGLGLGVMAKQIDGESQLTADYQLYLGARFFDIFENTGFFVESGIKNHLHLLSDGQFNGTFITVGTVFTF